jgi:hypothetical protein
MHFAELTLLGAISAYHRDDIKKQLESAYKQLIMSQFYINID